MQISQLLPEWSRKLWNEWHARILVLLSLTLQIVLVCLGSQRKRSCKLWIKAVLWFLYLQADYIAMLAIGVISSQLEDIYDDNGKIDENVELIAFWAPFLLLHLGGPDTITAYALEDNELWLRHLLGGVTQAMLTIYLLLMAWTGSRLSILAIFVIVAGMAKYAERTWSLWCASAENLKGFSREFGDFVGDTGRIVISEENVFHLAYMLFKNFMTAIVDTTREINWDFRKLVIESVKVSPPKITFKLIEVQLGFMYDILYTKAKLVHTRWGIGLRLVSFSSACLVLLLFSLSASGRKYDKIDLAITFVLLVGAVVLEIYATLVLIFSDWTRAWMQSIKTSSKIISCGQAIRKSVIRNSRWTNSVSQFSMLSFPFIEKHVVCNTKVLKTYFPQVYEFLEQRESITYTEVTDVFKERIVTHIVAKANELNQGSGPHAVTATLRKYGHDSTFSYFIQWRGVTDTIMIWHVATEICYHSEDFDGIVSANVESEYRLSLQISQYLMSMLLMYPLMLPGDERQENLQKARDEAMELFKKIEPSSKVRFHEALMLRCANEEAIPRRDYYQDSTLIDKGVVLYMEIDEIISDKRKKWGFIMEMWLNVLVSAASLSGGKWHAEQLRQGGELLSHVWLLVAHMEPNY